MFPAANQSKPATLQDVAKAAGVSTSTVLRAFKKDGVCHPVTRKKILLIASRLGYAPSLIASSLTTNSTRIIGIVIDSFEDPFFTHVFELLTRELQPRDFGVLIIHLNREDSDCDSSNMLWRYNIDGAFLASANLSENLLVKIQSRGIPIVSIFGCDAAGQDISVVGVDNTACGAMAAQTLCDRGHTKVALISGPQNTISMAKRNSGFLAKCAELRLEVVAFAEAKRLSYEAGNEAMTKILAQNCSIESVFCGDDLIAAGAMNYAKSKNIRIPDQLGFIGVNDMKMAAWSGYELTTIKLPVDAVVQSSVELMETLLTAGTPSKQVRILPTAIIDRGSVRRQSTCRPAQSPAYE